jgi:hypothetical protein
LVSSTSIHSSPVIDISEPVLPNGRSMFSEVISPRTPE